MVTTHILKLVGGEGVSAATRNAHSILQQHPPNTNKIAALNPSKQTSLKIKSLNKIHSKSINLIIYNHI